MIVRRSERRAWPAPSARPPPHLTGWKDTVYVPPGGSLRLVIRFGDYADPDTPYMFHCHVLQQEDRGLMGQFVLVERGQEPGDPAHEHSGTGS